MKTLTMNCIYSTSTAKPAAPYICHPTNKDYDKLQAEVLIS